MKLLHDFGRKCNGICLADFEAQGSELSGNFFALIDPTHQTL